MSSVSLLGLCYNGHYYLMPTRLMFLNTRDLCGADVAVHLMLMREFTPDEAEVFVLSNSEASDADEMRIRFAQMPQVHTEFLPFGRPVEALANKSKNEKILAYGANAAALMKAAAFVRRHRIQIIHATDRPRDASFAALLGRMTGAISVVHMHSNAGPELSRLSVWGLRHATAIFAVSDFVRDSLHELGLSDKKIHTVYNAVDSEHFNPDQIHDTGKSIRQRFGIPTEAPLIGIAARMNPWKGQRELIGAASRLRETHPNLHVLIIGASVAEMQADYERRAREGGIADRVHFVGFQKDVRPFLRAFDLFVHPSYEEPFGLAIVEAMAMRKPVIACNSGGVPEIITQGKDGWLVEPHSEEAVAAGISALLASPDKRQRMGECARETVLARFTPRQQCATVAQKYAALIAAH